jgi:hypothetical protein
MDIGHQLCYMLRRICEGEVIFVENFALAIHIKKYGTGSSAEEREAKTNTISR